MNILLIKPYWPYPYSKKEDTYNRIWPPLNLASCASFLEKNGFNVKILDCHALRVKPNKIKAYLKESDKIFVTSSSLDRWQCPNIDITPFLKSVRYIKEVTDEVYVLGYHGTVEPERILDLTNAKAIIRGEPECTVLEICQKNDLSGIKGISFKNNGKLTSTPQRELLDLKNFPIPSFHLLDVKKYFYEILGNHFSLFEITRGCKFRCKFCNKVMYGQGLRTKSIEQILKEITVAVEKFNVKTGYFIDLDFLSDRKLVEEICEYLIDKRYKFKWACQTRPDLLDIEILKRMKKAGCDLIHLGVETASQKLLDSVNKDMIVDQIKKSTKLCKKVGIKTLIFVLLGLPGETEQDREEALRFIKALEVNFVSFHKTIAYKGSQLFQEGIKYDSKIDIFLRRALFKYYLRPSYLRKLNFWSLIRSLKLFYGRINAL